MALTSDRDTPRRDGTQFVFPVKAATTIYAGAIVCLQAGLAVPGQTAIGLKCVGRAEHQVVNAGADGSVTCEVWRGCFRFNNSAAADALTLADVGSNCYLVDDFTVAKTDGTTTRSVCGIVRDVDASGVWVEI